MSRHTPRRTDTPPPSSPKQPSPKKGKGNSAPARSAFQLTSPYGAAFDTILYRIEINHARSPTSEEGQAALTRMAQYCRLHGADPQLRRRETYAPASQEEQVLYVRVRTDPVVWGRLRHQAQRLGLLPHLVKETNEIPPDSDSEEQDMGKSDTMAALVRSLLQAKEGRRNAE